MRCETRIWKPQLDITKQLIAIELAAAASKGTRALDGGNQGKQKTTARSITFLFTTPMSEEKAHNEVKLAIKHWNLLLSWLIVNICGLMAVIRWNV